MGKTHHFKEKQWTGKETFWHHYRYLNDVPIKDGEEVIDVITAEHTRWEIENENNNALKTKGYNLKHNF